MAKDLRRSKIRRGLALLVAVVMSIGGVGYTAVKSGEGQQVKTEGAQVYASDDERSEVLLTLERGDKYTLLEVDDVWCRIRIEASDTEGYALMEELELDADAVLGTAEAKPEEKPTEAPTEAPTEEPVEESSEALTGEPTEEPAAEPIGEPTEEPAAELTGEPAEEPAAEPTEEPAAEPTEEPTEAPADAGNDGPDEGDLIEQEYDAAHGDSADERMGLVKADMLCLRDAPDAAARILGALRQGARVTILGEQGGFLNISIGGMQGYVMSAYVEEIELDAQEAATTVWGTAVVNATSLNVRKSGSTSATLLYKLKKGERVMLRSFSGDWYCIETSQGKGYVLGDYLDKSVITGTSFKSGDKGDEVKEIQRRLIELKYLTGTADGTFGAATKSAVTAFQKAVGLTADGVVGSGTLNKLFAVSVSGGSETPTYTTLSYGDSGAGVTALQNRLRELGYMTANATGNFGTATKSAVIEFQKAVGLTADGVAGQTTQTALFATDAPAKGAGSSAITGTLKVGDKGDAVTELQKRLIELGYLATSATGTFGEATKAAVTEFQKMAGLTADGVAGTATVNALFATDAPARVDTTTLKQGDKGDSVKALQKRLIELGYLTGTADGTFGADTKAAVKEFQTAAGISADGVAGAATITALFSASAPRKPDGTLKRGDRGDAVVTLQKRLRELGYLTDTADGIFGDTTESAVKEFQKAVGLTADGVVGATTLAKLNAADAPEKAGAILRQGDSGDAVKSLQKRLIELGYLTGTADGKFGAGTKAALIEFQTIAGLKATGVADIETQQTLEASDAPEKGGVTLKQGDSGDAVKALQQRLIELKYMTGSADGSFGSSTKSAVMAFQQAAGLDADGVAGPATQAALYADDAPAADATDSKTLQVGSTGEAVKTLQKRLIELGYMTGSADGTFGSATKAAVKLFQKQVGLTVDGVAGESTQKALYASDAPKYDGSTSVDTDNSSTAEKIIATAKQYLGCSYVYGTSGPNTFDCSGFTQFVFKKYGYSLLRSALQQGYNDNYEKLTRSELKMGDIVCFNTISDNDLCDHVGIYISDGNFIHASSGGGCVMISNLDSGYYNRVFSWGRRILS